MDPAKKIAQARVSMLIDYPFWGHLALNLELVEKKGMPMPTMATDGSNLYYDPDFVNSCSLGELMGVIAHESGHCALDHIPRRENRDHTRWNIAADLAVNDLLVKEPAFHNRINMALPAGALIPGKTPGTDEFVDQYVEFIYSKLPEPIVLTVVTLDSHEEWSEWGKGEGQGKGQDDKEGKEKDKTGQGKSGSDQDKGQKDGAGSQDKDQSNSSGQGQKDGDDEDHEDHDLSQEWRERVAAAATAARMAGRFPGHLETIVGDVLQPKLNWKAILRDMITSCAKSDFRMMPPNKKHLWRGIYLPSLMGEEINIAVGIDTSGSISDDEIGEFLSEVKGICDAYSNYTVYLFACDAQIQEKWELRPFDRLPTKMKGRGGTSYRPVIEAVKKLPPVSSLVYLTDLYPNDGFPEQPFTPVIWVSVSDEKPPWGKLIKLPRNNGGKK